MTKAERPADMPNERKITVKGALDIVEARQEGRRVAENMKFSSSDQTIIATAISELARNIVEYAGAGEIVIEESEAGDKIVITARDAGPGIQDLAKAVQDGFSTGKGLGLGLPGTKRLMDEFEIHSQSGQGTMVRVAKKREP